MSNHSQSTSGNVNQQQLVPPALPSDTASSQQVSDSTGAFTGVVTQGSLELQLNVFKSIFRAEVDNHIQQEIERLLTVAIARLRTEIPEIVEKEFKKNISSLQQQLEAIIDAKLTLINAKLTFAETALQTRFGELTSRIDNVQRAADAIPPDAPMPEQSQVDQSTVVDQLKAKNDELSRLRTELSTLREKRHLTRSGTTDAYGHHGAADQEDDDVQRDARTVRPKARLGPRAPGVAEIIPDDPRFTTVLSYRRYRLLNTDPRQDESITAEVGLHVRRLEHPFRNRKFNGLKPVSVISFLDHFKRECDANHISEGAALLCLPKFLDGDAFISFDANESIGSEDIGGFSSYPAAVNFLLRSYASDANIEAAVDEFESIRQNSGEAVLDFARRVRKTARECGGVYTERELITRFQRGLMPEVRPLLTREPHEAKLATLHEAASLANKVFKSYAQLATTINSTGRRGQLPVNLSTAPSSDPSINMVDPVALVGNPFNGAPSTVRGDDSAILRRDAKHVAGTPVPSLNSDPQPRETHNPNVQPAATAEAEVDVVATLQRVHEWRQRDMAKMRQPAGASTSEAPRKSAIEQYMTLICYQCFGRGHTSPRCPLNGAHKDPSTKEQYEQLVRAQFRALSPNEQDSLAKAGKVPTFVVEENKTQAESKEETPAQEK